ncbi:hypothetical protein [Benzoatithermus flavus]|uniref:Uncharacterized protein n=1 Tax=Benzoatithermus flavus TaxID=3108223 RepID=A0ABU8XMD4_9PROT
MSQHDAYLDRMTTRLGELERELKILSEKVAHAGEERHEREIRELEASLAVAKERLQMLRRCGADCNEEMTQSFAQSFERLNGSFGRTRAALAGGSHPA